MNPWLVAAAVLFVLYQANRPARAAQLKLPPATPGAEPPAPTPQPAAPVEVETTMPVLVGRPAPAPPGPGRQAPTPTPGGAPVSRAIRPLERAHTGGSHVLPELLN